MGTVLKHKPGTTNAQKKAKAAKAAKARAEESAKQEKKRKNSVRTAAERGIIAVGAIEVVKSRKGKAARKRAVAEYAKRKNLSTRDVIRFMKQHLKQPQLITSTRIRAPGAGRKVNVDGRAYKLREAVSKLLSPVVEAGETINKAEAIEEATNTAAELEYADPRDAARRAVNTFCEENELSSRKATDTKEPPEGWEEALKRYITGVRIFCRKHNLELFNFDETGLCPNMTRRIMITRKGQKVVKGPKAYDDHYRITVVLGFSEHRKLPPFVIFKGKSSAKKINPVEKEIKGFAHATVSTTGWARTETCEEHMQALVQKSSNDPDNLRAVFGPRVCMLVDGYAAHKGYVTRAAKLRKSHGMEEIKVITGPRVCPEDIFLEKPVVPTHLWQPVDVGAAKQFKQNYCTLASQKKPKTKAEVITLINQAWRDVPQQTLRSYMVRSGFAKADGPRAPNRHAWVASEHGAEGNPDDDHEEPTTPVALFGRVFGDTEVADEDDAPPSDVDESDGDEPADAEDDEDADGSESEAGSESGSESSGSDGSFLAGIEGDDDAEQEEDELTETERLRAADKRRCQWQLLFL